MNASLKRMTLGQSLAALAAVSLMAAVAPPSLQSLRTRLQSVTCANNLRACHQAWGVYGHQYGVWMAPNDQGDASNGYDPDGDGYAYDQQWPYCMNVYASGYTLPDGEDVYVGGWWSPSRRGSVENLPSAAALQCPTLAMGPETNPWWYHFTTYSYAVMGGREGIDGQVTYRADDYPVPDQMTHPSTTVQLHDLGGSGYEGGTNAWTYYVNLFTLDPHDGRSNYLMCDGHVDLLAFEALNETMWQSRWVPSGPAGGAN